VNNGLNQTTQVGGAGFSYDANQNTASALGSSYGYDASNRLTSATIAGTAYAFGYDPGGRLYSSTGGRFQYVGVQLAGEYDSSGVLTTRHVPGPGLDQPVATYFGGARVQQIADERGSVVGVADAGGAVTINRYDEYGVPSAANRFQYTGQAWMAPGLYNYRARAYAPQLGRFLQTDPIGYAAGPNVYGYVSGDPVNLVDPFGLQEGEPPTGIDDIVVTGHRNWRERQTCGFFCPTSINIVTPTISEQMSIPTSGGISNLECGVAMQRTADVSRDLRFLRDRVNPQWNTVSGLTEMRERYVDTAERGERLAEGLSFAGYGVAGLSALDVLFGIGKTALKVAAGSFATAASAGTSLAAAENARHSRRVIAALDVKAEELRACGGAN